MMKNIKILLSLMMLALWGLTSCGESTEAGEFDNWQVRNTQFIDSIANVARANADGDWKIILNAAVVDTSKVQPNYEYVYCQVIEEGSGLVHPISTDSVFLNYSGRLIPSATYPDGYLFDSSYKGELNPSFNVPVGFPLSGTVDGFYTAVQKMVAGDVWKVYVPYQLAYGAAGTTGVPGYSALVFDINLVSFHRAKVE